jgi:hypothetical protein
MTNYNVKHSGQGLLTVYQDDKETSWKIQNKNGRWMLYCVLDGKTHEHPRDFADIIHDPEKLSLHLGGVFDCRTRNLASI